ncbi:hypothetical protein CEP54_005497 [Fusarium duplospermum]|uniref:Uncharacterized protein n=1 Tax=Fusarium duplospermum TaxID=1325734 RepID=A0A428QC91_9HYPO|nr:hypothetical protein CEP54_005497 [Fusarium duplospermum]
MFLFKRPKPSKIERPSSPDSYWVDLRREKQHIILPACLTTSRRLHPNEVTIYNEALQVTQIKGLHQRQESVFPCLLPLVVFIDGGSESSTSGPLPWTVTFAPTSLYNFSGSLAPHVTRSTLCAIQEAILAFLESARSNNFHRLWQRIIIALPDEADMERMVTWIDDDVSENNGRHAMNVLTDQGRMEAISYQLGRLKRARKLNVEFWLLPKDQMMVPASDEVNTGGSSRQR